MKMHLKQTLYQEPAIAEFFSTQKAKTEAQSTKFKVTLETMVMHAGTCRCVEQKTSSNVTCAVAQAIQTPV